MKKIWWVLIIITGALIFPTFMIVVPIIILSSSWWWLWGTLILEFIIGIIIGIIFLVIKLQKKPIPKLKMDIGTARKRAVHEMKYDDDNPDNFKIDYAGIMRVGEPGKDRTPIAWLSGQGTEMGQRRDVIINLNDPKREIIMLINKSDEECKENIRTLAENPEEHIIIEKVKTRDAFGEPVETTRTRKTSSTEKKEEEIKQKAEEASAF